MEPNEEIEKKSEPRAIDARYGSVEITVNESGPTYMFRIRKLPLSGTGILVKEDSGILEHLKVGDKWNMKYNPIVASDLPEYLKTKIKHIKKGGKGRVKGHCWVDLLVVEN